MQPHSTDSTIAVYEPQMAIDNATNKVEPIDTGGNKFLFAIRLTIGVLIFVMGMACLIFGLWFVSLFALVFAIPFLSPRRKPRSQRVGLWKGECPRCKTEAYVHAPPLADHFRFSCPGCTRPIELRSQRYEAAGVWDPQ